MVQGYELPESWLSTFGNIWKSMTESSLFTILLLIYFVGAGVVFISGFFIKVPYGRYFNKSWGLAISNQLGWMIMESPSPILFAILFLKGSVPRNGVLLIIFLLWETHYVHRAFIYPFTLHNGRKQMPIAVMVLAILFNLGNAYLNGRYLFTFSNVYEESWLWDPRFILGIVIFIIGFVINRWADHVLRTLRKPGDPSYYIPQGGLYRWISCPNYFGEIIEWAGWALATWSLPGTIFTVWTFANLAPRANAHHAWYKQKFPGYPKSRKALFPGVW
jgi:3-oxo-5-alpha-steroid 4-dehydrogenase 1